MATQKKDKATTKQNSVVQKRDIEELWDVIDEMQENLNFLNDKVQRIMNRMGLD